MMEEDEPDYWPPGLEAEIDPLTSLPIPPRKDFLKFGAPFHFRWDTCETWLAARGYRLYPRRFPADWCYSKAWYPPPFIAPAPLPYAKCVRASLTSEYPPTPPMRIAWAQDSMNRDIALKLLRTDGDEYRIYHTLLRCAGHACSDTCAGVLLPLAILDTPFNYAFVAMPRWGNLGDLAHIDTVKDVLQFMQCTLKGLTLLHSHRISHRDISIQNFLVDCYSPELSIQEMQPILDNYRRTADAKYCIFDFNASIQVSPDASLRTYLRPADESTITASAYQPADIDLGEHAYNPFAYDVACIGNVYKVWFSSVVAFVPLLAPLLDRMTHHDSARRFTAEEALSFLNAVNSELSDDVRHAPVSLEVDFAWNVVPARYWSWTPPGFVELWGHYQTMPWTWGLCVIDRICSWPWGWRAVRYVRAVLQR